MNMSFKNNVRLQCFNGSNNAADLVISYQTNIVCAPLCMQFILTSQRNAARLDRRIGRGAMIPRGLLGDEMERERSDRLSVSEDDGDVPRSGQRYFFGPKLVFSRGAEG